MGIQTNTTCDIYRSGNAPPNPPDVAGVPCYLEGDFRSAQEAAVQDATEARWTHVLHVNVGVDVRDGLDPSQNSAGTWAGLGYNGTADKVYVPDQNGTPFLVVFVERVGWNTPLDRLRVYLLRQQPPAWPTNNL